jgi:hypothetical protein
MSVITTTFKKVGNQIKETFRPKPKAGVIFDIGKANDKIAELETKLETVKPTTDHIESVTPNKVETVKTQSTETNTFTLNISDYSTKREARDTMLKMWTKSVDPISHNDYKLGMDYIENSNLPETIEKKMSTVDQLKTSGFTIVNPFTEPTKSKIQPHYFVNHGYYTLYDNGVCYLQIDLNNDIPVELVVLTNGSQTTPCSISYNSFNLKYRQMTKQEYDYIVKSNTPLETLLMIYQRKASETQGFGQGDTRLNKVLLDMSNTIPVF